MEWNTPVGETKSCGGIAAIRLNALLQVGGYDDRLIAGEEPELCVRLRGAGWRVRRVDAEMARHDAAMTHFGQWWRRAQRSGHAYADAIAHHGGPPEWHGVRPSISIWFWSFVWPLLTLVLTASLGPVGLFTLAVYPLMAVKIGVARRRRFGDTWPACLLYGIACVVSKWAQLSGQLRYLSGRLSRQEAKIIEYKRQQPSRLRG
jgi:hypothetical protein